MPPLLDRLRGVSGSFEPLRDAIEAADGKVEQETYQRTLFDLFNSQRPRPGNTYDLAAALRALGPAALEAGITDERVLAAFGADDDHVRSGRPGERGWSM